MSKKYFIISLVLWLVLVAFYVHSAVVREKTVNLKNIDFLLEAGDKIYIFDAGAKVRVYCTPADAKRYYLKVPEGKTFGGMFTLK